MNHSIIGTEIPLQVVDFIKSNLKSFTSFDDANHFMFVEFGIEQFFESEEDFRKILLSVNSEFSITSENDRAEYGDFQTNSELAGKVIDYIKLKGVNPKVVIEPTCGKGSFIVKVLEILSNIEFIIGVEIYKPYLWECKFNIMLFYLSSTKIYKPKIRLYHRSVFDVKFNKLVKGFSSSEKLILGNPPWVTNSMLGALNSSNLPKKGNFKGHNGFDAITGKGNFDIAEYIILNLIESFQGINGHVAILVKNSVIKNVLIEQINRSLPIGNIEKLVIDSKKEFNVSVEAALFFCRLNDMPSVTCDEYDFYNPSVCYRTFGWVNNKFVSNIHSYKSTLALDGICPFEWRQGLKHDLSAIMEFGKVNERYENSAGETFVLEGDLVYGFLKSSDLKGQVLHNPRKYTIVTQKKIGQETNFIKNKYPLTFSYLSKYKDLFSKRKSSIYKNKPPFSIFGIGEYSFKPFKVAISGLYKRSVFSLILPLNEKPIMLDDTCYFLGFDVLEYAVYTYILLNSEVTSRFLQSITFTDAKRVFTKDVLMRIDLKSLAQNTDHGVFEKQLLKFNTENRMTVSIEMWEAYIQELSPSRNQQIELFA